MKIGKNYLPFAMVLLPFAMPFAVLFAADFQVSASLDRSQIALNEQAVLSLVITGNGGANIPQPQLPALPDFQVVNAGRSQSFTWINGQASSSVTNNYVLTPLKEGRFTIPSLSLQIQGQTAQTAPLTLEVVKGDPSAVQGTAREEGATRPARSSQGPAAVFITGTVDKTSVYVGEPVLFTFRLYNRVSILSQPNYQPPQMTGFWTEEVPPQRNYKEIVKGIPYNVTELRTALFPTAPGKAHVGSASLTVALENVGTDPFGSDFFSQFFGRAEQRTLKTEPLAIQVRPLPEPKPASFQGAVGDYRLSAQTDKDRVAVGQPVTLTLTISGRGNIKSLPDLPLPSLINFRTFDANASTTLDKKDGEIAGSKAFKTVLIPTASGELVIPSVTFSFFDPATKSYRTVSSRAITLHVTPGAAGASTGVGTLPAAGGSASGTGVASSAAPGIKLLSEDIRYIRTPATVESEGEPLYARRWYRILHVFIVGLLGVGGLTRLYHRLFLSNTLLSRFKKARERSLTGVKKTETYLTANDIKGAGGHLAGVLQDYLTAKLGVEDRSVSMRDSVERLKSRGLLPHTGEKVRNIWETFDLYQFAPAQVQASEVRASMETLNHVIDEVEKEIVWKT